jgi:hypothetical protein
MTVNTHGEDSSPVWRLDPQSLGKRLRQASEAAGVSGAEAARRLGHSKQNNVSNWWNAKVGISDQLVYFVCLARESPAARQLLFEYMGGEKLERAPEEIGEIEAALVRASHLPEWREIRTVIEALLRSHGLRIGVERDAATPRASTA